ncbi:HAD family hydrolase [Phytohabitans sp. ZYX-F-186]|uniref:HAD family hydrolase n=1 Tax=Phytohabitans maris TaxID=3071409 RepID=A0ABU0ZNZ8_9ACTN|nr:HAD family hydrolase [Phytohabitans sp. ZYX-F-186]MDQ7908757.1 HAD family hydrolase [Phytohabitans sp. ZYX-F-186]
MVLDMAGTTIRDDGLVEAAVSIAVDRVEPGRVVSEADFVQARGKPKRDLFDVLFPNDEAASAAALEFFEGAMLDAATRGPARAVAGAEDAIRDLKLRGSKVVLTTGFNDAIARALVRTEGWTDLVDAVVTPGVDVRGRPYPDMILTALMRTHASDVRRVAVCGDTVSDLEAGNRSGAGFVAGVLNGAHSRDRLETANNTALLDSVSALPDALLQHPGSA